MYNTNMPSRSELPSSAKLLRSTALAIVTAGAILITIVLPSEYGIDPTGAGGALGLTEMGEIKMQLIRDAETERALAEQPLVSQSVAVIQAEPPKPEIVPTVTTVPTVAAASASPAEPSSEAKIRRDELSLTLTPGEGVEVKLVMNEGAQVHYEWTANGGVLNYDAHGDGGGQSISYEKGRGVPDNKGVLEAAFDGNHGWFWRNRTDANVTITLRTQGAYSDLKQKL